MTTEQHGGGVRVYTENLLREIVAMDTPHEFVFMYRNPKLVGTYGNGSRIREVTVEASSKLTWDQLSVRKVEKKEKFDLIFNPKYSIPLMAECPTVFVNHGLPWYVMPWASKFADRLSHRYLIPRYTKKANAIIAVSNSAREHMIEYLRIEPERVHTVYLGVDETFRQPIPQERLDEVRHSYGLPERFFLYVGQIYPPKNFARLLQAYSKVGPELGISLVVAGFHRRLCADDAEIIERLGKPPWVVWPGWINRDDIPAFYALAEALVLPSLYESFGIPLVEAMSIGCPVITSDRYSSKEIAEKAGLLVNPEDIDAIAEGMHAVANDRELRKQLVNAGLERSLDFSWRKCAQETLRVLDSVYN